MNFIKKNLIFTLCYFIVVTITIILVYYLGFKKTSEYLLTKEERLRDITFYIWDNYSLKEHGFLVFYDMSYFYKKIAYSNHSYLYLFYMYFFYKVEILTHFPMRVSSAISNICIFSTSIFYVLSKSYRKVIGIKSAILFLISTAIIVSMPAYWVSAARFNVDNIYLINFSFILLASFIFCYANFKGYRVWVVSTVLTVFFPRSAVILGMALLLASLSEGNEFKARFIKLSLFLIIIGFSIYIVPASIAKIMGFELVNSSWLFRSGLDGDLSYFSNAIQAIIYPYNGRSFFMGLGISLLLLIFQLINYYVWYFYRKYTKNSNINNEIFDNYDTFIYLIFSQYIFTCLFWPQSVSIHPYLYDVLLLAPILFIVAFNFVRLDPSIFSFKWWGVTLLFLLSFNLLQVAQGKCNDCRSFGWQADKSQKY
jgi:hypothetical protein